MARDDIGLSGVRTLIDRALARENPITHPQFNEFLKRPDGPQGHPDMIGWRRLPDRARLLDAMPNGEIVWEEGDTVVWDSGRRFDLPFKREKDCWPQVNFILPDGTVVSHARDYDSMDGMDRPGSLYIGANRISDSSWNVTELSDGSVAWTSGKTFYRWYVDGRLDQKKLKKDRYFGFALLSDGRVLAKMNHESGRAGYTNSLVDLDNEQELFFDGTGQPVVCWCNDDDFYALIQDSMDFYEVVKPDEYKIVRYNDRFREKIFRAKGDSADVLVRLSDQRFVVRRRTWDTAFWQLKQGECPRFERVSRAFQLNGEDCYYGQLGDQIFTMRFPASFAKD